MSCGVTTQWVPILKYMNITNIIILTLKIGKTTNEAVTTLSRIF